jgi:hypothetical protein
VSQGAQVIREPLPEIPHELLQEVEIRELVPLVEDEVRPLGQGAPRAELTPPAVAEPVGVAAGTEPLEGGLQPRAIDAELARGLREDPAGGAHRVEDLVALAGLERAGHAVMLEQSVEIDGPHGQAVWAPPAVGQRGADVGPPPAVAADEAREDGASLLEQQLVQQREGAGHGGGGGLHLGRPPYDEGGWGLLP